MHCKITSGRTQGLTRTTGLPELEVWRSVNHGQVHTRIWGHKENKEMKVER